MCLVKVDPNRRTEVHLAKGHVLQEITNQSNTSTVPAIAIGHVGVSCPTGSIGPGPTVSVVLANSDVGTAKTGEGMVAKVNPFDEGSGEVGLTVVVGTERSRTVEVLA